MAGIEMIDPEGACNALGRPAAPPQLAKRGQFECLKRGLIVELGGHHSSVVRLLPPLIVTEAQIGHIAKVKNEEDRLVVLNRVARSVIDSARSQDPEYVFVRVPKTRKAKPGCERPQPQPCPVKKMNSTAWKNVGSVRRTSSKGRAVSRRPTAFVACAYTTSSTIRRLRLCLLRHWRHTFGRRLRAAGVSFEDRQNSLGHKSGRITTHYSAAELANLIAAAEKVCEENSRKSPAITLLRRRAG